MSNSLVYQRALDELSVEYDLSPCIVQGIGQDANLSSDINFICNSLDARQRTMISAFKRQFHRQISDTESRSSDVLQDRSCGFIIKCYANGYREFCGLQEKNHDAYVKTVTHGFQKKKYEQRYRF